MKQHISIERTIHGVMVAFALFSVGNVASFFTDTGHYLAVSFIGAIALGTAVAATAIMLTGIDMVKQTHRYVAMFAIVHIAVIVSGYVQMQNYVAHGMTFASAAAMGFAIPWFGECLTAIGLSLYQAAERRRKIDDADHGLELKLAEAFADVLDAVDSEKSVRHVQRHIDTIIKHKADKLLQQYIPTNATIEPQKLLQSTNAERVSTDESGMSSDKRRASLSSRRNDADKRRAALMAMLNADYAGLDVDTLNKSELGRAMNVDARTIGRDIEQLRNEGMLNCTVGS